jgi:hypothetical protein
MADVISTESILGSVKKLIGSDSYFDQDLVLHINSVFSALQQMGVGPEDGFSISDDTTLWGEYTNNINIMNMVKSYMVLRVKLLFDISTASSYLIEQWRKECAEYEWRLNVACDKEGE